MEKRKGERSEQIEILGFRSWELIIGTYEYKEVSRSIQL